MTIALVSVGLLVVGGSAVGVWALVGHQRALAAAEKQEADCQHLRTGLEAALASHILGLPAELPEEVSNDVDSFKVRFMSAVNQTTKLLVEQADQELLAIKDASLKRAKELTPRYRRLAIKFTRSMYETKLAEARQSIHNDGLAFWPDEAERFRNETLSKSGC
ncbi:MAG TPA: hypothetical protein VGB52_06190 [Actinomycetota bacterium]